MAWSGLIIGAASFLVIGLFHPVVIKCEYHFSARIWPVFLAGGLLFSGLSLFVENLTGSAILAVIGFTMLWSILELKHQEQRVAKGWFPANPKHEAKAAKAADRESASKS